MKGLRKANLYTNKMNCVILDTSPVHIGENAFIAPGVCIACAGHSIDPLQRAEGISTSKPITIKKKMYGLVPMQLYAVV